jgi:hypothetical protein
MNLILALGFILTLDRGDDGVYHEFSMPNLVAGADALHWFRFRRQLCASSTDIMLLPSFE